MTREMSRQQRKEAVMAETEKMFEAMEQWYDAHPDATFEEIGFCWRNQAGAGAAAKAAKGVGRLVTGRSPANQREIRARLIAAAVAMCCRWVRSRPQ